MVLHVVDRGADHLAAVEHHVQRHRRRQVGLELRQHLADGINHADRVGTGLAENGQQNGRIALVPALGIGVFLPVQHPRHVFQAHGRAVDIGDDLLFEFARIVELAAGADDGGTGGAVQRAGRHVDVGGGNGAGQLVDADIAGGQRGRIGLDAHGILGVAEHADLGDAVDGGKLAGQQRLGIFVQFRRFHRLGTDRHEQHRHVGRVHLAEGGGLGHRLGQVAGGGRNRGLNVLRRAVQVAAEVELDLHAGGALLARRGHLVDALDGGEAVFQRRRDRGGHRVGIGARQRGAHFDGREVDVGKVGDRQGGIAIAAEDHQRGHAQRGHHRTFDEGKRQIHLGLLTLVEKSLNLRSDRGRWSWDHCLAPAFR